MNGAPADIAERRYERWVMRAVELAHGSYPADGVEAERMLLLRMQDSLSGSVSPTDPWREGGSTPEEAGGLFSGYGEDHVQDVRSLVFCPLLGGGRRRVAAGHQAQQRRLAAGEGARQFTRILAPAGGHLRGRALAGV
jgi:hypothetical protein